MHALVKIAIESLVFRAAISENDIFSGYEPEKTIFTGRISSFKKCLCALFVALTSAFENS